MERATAVFSGKVLSIKGPAKFGVTSSADPVTVRFKVDRVWKGVETTPIIVRTAVSGASCGYEGFEVKGEFLVFAYESQGELTTNLCSRTQELAAAKSVLAELGPGSAPARSADRGDSPVPLIGAIAVLLLLATGLVWSGWLRRKRDH
ncbi:hypothetical protein MO973_03910 [Paenibacillus sp. TRM 82003]|nr:hypothetical protein [Paenibacillus sp. TRM 82003]